MAIGQRSCGSCGSYSGYRPRDNEVNECACAGSTLADFGEGTAAAEAPSCHGSSGGFPCEGCEKNFKLIKKKKCQGPHTRRRDPMRPVMGGGGKVGKPGASMSVGSLS